MSGRRSRWGAAITAFAVAAVLLLRPWPGPRLLEVVQRLNHPLEAAARPTSPAGAPALARYRWTAERVDAEWARAVSAGSVMLRSPRLDLPSSDELYAIVVTLPPLARVDRAVLLWSGTPSISAEDYARNRRDLMPLSDRQAIVELRGREIQAQIMASGTPEPIRYLYLHFPAAGSTRDVVESISVVTASDMIAVAPTGQARIPEGGEVRDVVYTSGPGLSYRLDVPAHARLLFGLRIADPGTTVRAQVRLEVGGREKVVFDHPVTGGAWHDFTAPLPAEGPAVLRLSVTSEGKSVPVSWSTPMILEPEETSRRPNVVLYVLDAMSAGRLGLYGARPSVSPVLDDLGRRGLVFARAYTAATWTKPSVTSLLTSLYPQTHGLGARYFSDPLPDSVVTLADALRTNGYVTAQFSANALAGTLSNLDKGFDWSFMPEAFGDAKGKGSPRKIGADTLNEKVLPWIEAHAAERFFLCIHSVDTHPPFVAPGCENASNPPAAQAAAAAFNDREIGRLLQRFVDLGLASQTLFVVTADHGEAFGEHGRGGHGVSVYDEEARVPLILHGPGRVAPEWREDPVSLVDVMPTILDLCSIPVGRAAQGRSLVSRQGSAGRSRPVFVTRFVYPQDLDAVDPERFESRAVIDFPWKLIATDEPGGGRRLELYDLRTDSTEREDRARAEPESVTRLDGVLQDFLRGQAESRARFLVTHGDPQAQRGDGEAKPRLRLPSAEALDQLRSLGYLR
ncbi:MAG: sulfatase [Thermoanaerobaculia bacterium]